MNKMPELPKQPLVEVFGYPINNLSSEAVFYQGDYLAGERNEDNHLGRLS